MQDSEMSMLFIVGATMVLSSSYLYTSQPHIPQLEHKGKSSITEMVTHRGKYEHLSQKEEKTKLPF
jgi:hypothetical protein